MSAIKKQLYLALSNYLMLQLKHTDGVPSLVTVDKDFGQFDLMKEGIISVPLPAILISFPDTGFESQLGGDQTGEGVLKIKVGIENFYDSNNYSPNRELALNFFDFNERTHNAINNFKMEKVSGIQRIGEAEDDNHDAVIVTEITYRYNMYIDGKAPVQNVQADITTEFKSEIPPPDVPELDNDWVLPE